MEVYRVTYDWLTTEGKELLDQHYAEVPYALSPEGYELNSPMYKVIEAQGNLLCLVAVEEGKLVGYVTGMSTPMMHNADKLVFMTSSFYTIPERRKQGCAKQLYSELKAVCEQAGIDYIHYTVNSTFPEAEALVKSLGMEQVETTYSVKVGG
jgi:L-amino acid N-acyltransferase YncA